jgi:hypothetical protein
MVMFGKSESVLDSADNWLDHVKIVLHDLPFIVGQVEQVVDLIDISFEGFDVGLSDFLAIGFKPVRQVDDAVVAPGDGCIAASLMVSDRPACTVNMPYTSPCSSAFTEYRLVYHS